MNRIDWESPFAFSYAQTGRRHDIGTQWMRLEKVWNCEAGVSGILQKNVHRRKRAKAERRKIQKKRLTAQA